MTHPPKAETSLALRLLEERRAQHQANLDGWTEPNGYLVPTEPDADERVKIRALLAGAIHELSYLLSADPAPPVPASAGAAPLRAFILDRIAELETTHGSAASCGWHEGLTYTYDMEAAAALNELKRLDAALSGSGPSLPAPFKGHIDSDCEVYRGVGHICTCETPAEKAERAKERAECEAERDAASMPAPAEQITALTKELETTRSHSIHWERRATEAEQRVAEQLLYGPRLPAPAWSWWSARRMVVDRSEGYVVTYVLTACDLKRLGLPSPPASPPEAP
jgi:hypothetical protein